jgi:hypothetical protein
MTLTVRPSAWPPAASIATWLPVPPELVPMTWVIRSAITALPS